VEQHKNENNFVKTKQKPQILNQIWDRIVGANTITIQKI